MNDNLEIATLAGGCFWCTEALFTRLKGVISVTPGYAGGNISNPTYEEVCSGTTGHAETIQIIFNPSIISFGKILDIFWHTHNPTTLNQQGNDKGPQYRSVIFFHSQNQKRIAEKSKKEIEDSKVYINPVVTQIIPFTNFYEAEDYHKKYFERNSSAGYCNLVISPKVDKLINTFSEDIKDEYKI